MKSLKSTKGFTLVELIVVIAILGILAAVAVPAYTGYLDKAKEAADTQVVSAVNTAFGAALATNALDYDDITAATFTEGAGSTPATISVTVSGDDASETKAGKVASAFTTFFDGNIGELNYYSGLTYNTTTHVWTGN